MEHVWSSGADRDIYTTLLLDTGHGDVSESSDHFFVIGVVFAFSHVLQKLVPLEQLLLFLVRFHPCFHLLLVTAFEAAHFDLCAHHVDLDREHDYQVDEDKEPYECDVCPAHHVLGLHVLDAFVILGVPRIGHQHEPITVQEHEVAQTEDDELVAHLETVQVASGKWLHVPYVDRLHDAHEHDHLNLQELSVSAVDDQGCQDQPSKDEKALEEENAYLLGVHP